MGPFVLEMSLEPNLISDDTCFTSLISNFMHAVSKHVPMT